MFAAELAEMLSTDMQNEGLCGRTLTLKLKTASFEVLQMFRFCFLLHRLHRLIMNIVLAWFSSPSAKDIVTYYFSWFEFQCLLRYMSHYCHACYFHVVLLCSSDTKCAIFRFGLEL